MVRPRVNSEGRRAGGHSRKAQRPLPMAPLFALLISPPRSLCNPCPPHTVQLFTCNPCLSLLGISCPQVTMLGQGHLSLRCPSLVGTCLKDGTSLEMRPWPPVTTLTIRLPAVLSLSFPRPHLPPSSACLLSCLGFLWLPGSLYHSIFAGACLCDSLPWTRVFFFLGFFQQDLFFFSSCFSSILLSLPPPGRVYLVSFQRLVPLCVLRGLVCALWPIRVCLPLLLPAFHNGCLRAPPTSAKGLKTGSSRHSRRGIHLDTQGALQLPQTGAARAGGLCRELLLLLPS